MLFNRTPLVFGKQINPPSMEDIISTTGLFKASLQDAALYGGPLVREILSSMNIRGDRKHVVVDVKKHNLMPNMIPAIPGWHTDGVPRNYSDGVISSGGREAPNINLQEEIRPPRFHLMVTGVGCLTDFATKPIELDVPKEPTTELYKIIQEQCLARKDELGVITAPSCQVVEWDWWALHTAVPSQAREWRLLVRVCETDYEEPLTDLRQVIRIQEQVTVMGQTYGW